MKRRIKVKVEVERQGLLGKKKVLEDRIIEVDEATYRKMKREQKNRPFTMDELMYYDEIFDEWDD